MLSIVQVGFLDAGFMALPSPYVDDDSHVSRCSYTSMYCYVDSVRLVAPDAKAADLLQQFYSNKGTGSLEICCLIACAALAPLGLSVAGTVC